MQLNCDLCMQVLWRMSHLCGHEWRAVLWAVDFMCMGLDCVGQMSYVTYVSYVIMMVITCGLFGLGESCMICGFWGKGMHHNGVRGWRSMHALTLVDGPYWVSYWVLLDFVTFVGPATVDGVGPASGLGQVIVTCDKHFSNGAMVNSQLIDLISHICIVMLSLGSKTVEDFAVQPSAYTYVKMHIPADH